MGRATYHTRQRTLLRTCLELNRTRCLTVREVCGMLEEQDERVGHTTVYRNLESLASTGEVIRLTGAGGETRYRLAPEEPCGQLVCLDCGTVQPLDCAMLGSFSEHVRSDHGFAVDTTRTVLYGHCAGCQRNGNLHAGAAARPQTAPTPEDSSVTPPKPIGA